MQVARGALDDDLLQHQTAQRRGDGGRPLVPHIGVADQRHVGFDLGAMRGDEGGQRGRAGLLLALDQDRHMAGQAAAVAQGAAGLDKSHHLALVVRRAARHDAPPRRRVGKARLERLGLPQVERVRRLHVVMAIEQHMRRAGARGAGMSDDHGVARRRAHGRCKAKSRQLIANPLRGALALRLVGGVGGHRGDFEQLEQPRQRGVEVGVKLGKGGVERGQLGLRKLTNPAIRYNALPVVPNDPQGPPCRQRRPQCNGLARTLCFCPVI